MSPSTRPEVARSLTENVALDPPTATPNMRLGLTRWSTPMAPPAARSAKVALPVAVSPFSDWPAPKPEPHALQRGCAIAGALSTALNAASGASFEASGA
jgi:hypothetical protein